MPYKNPEDKKRYLLEYRKRKRIEQGWKPRSKMSPEEQAIRQRIASRKHYNANKEKERARSKKWRDENKDLVRNQWKNRRARKKGAQGSHTEAEWQHLKREYGFMCPYCQKHEPEIVLTRDHIIPLSKGGSNYIDNIQPLCMSCNCSKQDKIEDRYETYMFRFEIEK